MTQMTTKYLGELRTSSIHLQSSNEIITDAPLDNNGKGEAFSPTDLLCTSLSCCMTTLMGIYANREGIDIDGITSEIHKTMEVNPRKVKTVKIHFSINNLNATDKQIKGLKNAARTCPVALSLSEELKQEISFSF